MWKIVFHLSSSSLRLINMATEELFIFILKEFPILPSLFVFKFIQIIYLLWLIFHNLVFFIKIRVSICPSKVSVHVCLTSFIYWDWVLASGPNILWKKFEYIFSFIMISVSKIHGASFPILWDLYGVALYVETILQAL